MDYAQVFDSLDALREYLNGALNSSDVPAAYIRSLPYSDFGKAVFGSYLFSADSGLGPLDSASPGYRAALAAAMPSASLVVWMKFGRELTEVPTVFGTLAELNAVALVSPPLVTFRQAGIPAAVDYSAADSGVSRTYTVSPDGYKRTDRRLTSAAVSQYKGLDWQFLVGDSAVPQVRVPSISVSRPSP